MAQLFANNAASVLASSANASQTSLSLASGTGALFPSPSGGDFFEATLTQAGLETSWEVVRVTARSSDTLTVARAQEGTSAAAWAAGSKLELRLTAGVLWPLPNIDQSIAPTWTGAHRFDQAVGIGASSSSSTGSMLVVAGAQFNSLLVRSTGNSGGVGSSDVYLGSASGDLSGGIVSYDHTTNTLGLGAGGAVKASINSSGAVRVGGSFGTAGQVMTSAGSSSPAAWGNLPAAASPTASVGLTAANGSAGTFMRSDAAPALSQAISPTWTDRHVFSKSGDGDNSAVSLASATPGLQLKETDAAVDSQKWNVRVAAGIFRLTTQNDAESVDKVIIQATRSGNAITGIVLGNITDAPTVDLPADNQSLRIGAGNDLRLFHDGTDSYIRNDTGILGIIGPSTATALGYWDFTNRRLGLLGASGSGAPQKTFHIIQGAFSYPMRLENQGGSIAGMEFKGSTSGANPVSIGCDGDKFRVETANTLKIVVNDGDGDFDLVLDNQELRIGASNDLRLYHDGTDSYIENDTGNLVLKVNGELSLSEVGTTTTAPSAGGAGALPATPAEYVTVIINGTTRKVAVY